MIVCPLRDKQARGEPITIENFVQDTIIIINNNNNNNNNCLFAFPKKKQKGDKRGYPFLIYLLINSAQNQRKFDNFKQKAFHCFIFHFSLSRTGDRGFLMYSCCDA